MAKIGCPHCGKTIDDIDTTCPHCGRASVRLPAANPTDGMTDAQLRLFHAEMRQAEKDTTAGVLLALFLGGLGVHHFYMRSWIAGVVYLVFCWTFVPAILGLIEAFTMSSRVRNYNRRMAELIAARIRAAAETRLA